MRKRLTLQSIRDFTCPTEKKIDFLWDTDSRLGLRVTYTGAKAFVFQARLNGETIRRTIGDANAWPLQKARAEANALQMLIDQRIDPRAVVRAEAAKKEADRRAQEAARAEAEARAKYTLRALCDAYVRYLESRGKIKGAADARSVFKVHVYPKDTAKKPAREITPIDVAMLVRSVSEAGKTRSTGVLRSYLHAAYMSARRAPLSAELPSELIAFQIEQNPVEIVPTIAKATRDRVLSPAELHEYINRLGDSLPDKALRLALLSGGQRMAQILRARVTDWDAETKTLRLLDGKGRRQTPREHLLPLAPQAAALVEQLISRAIQVDMGTQAPPYLFCVSIDTRMANETPGKRVTEICADMKCPTRFDLRDVRRTCETQLASLGISRDIRAQLLSHGISGVQAVHYDRYEYITEKRAALIAWENRLGLLEQSRRDPV